jgi:hypothetical protein
MQTIKELVLSIYEDNFSHFDFDESMGGEDCDCHLHAAMNLIMRYWENDNTGKDS